MDENRKKPESPLQALTFLKDVTRISLNLAVWSVFLVTLTSEGFAGSLTRTVFEVNNVSCGSCLFKINSALAGLDGFVEMSADLYQGKIVIDHRPTLSATDISRAIAASGYPARVSGDSVAEPDTGAIEKPAGQGKWYSRKVGCRGCATSYSCGGSASTWREFYFKYFGDDR